MAASSRKVEAPGRQGDWTDLGTCGEALATLASGEWGSRPDLTAPRCFGDSPGRSWDLGVGWTGVAAHQLELWSSHLAAPNLLLICKMGNKANLPSSRSGFFFVFFLRSGLTKLTHKVLDGSVSSL